MYCCIYASGNLPILLDCARQFSPLIETYSDMVVFDARGLEGLHGPPESLADAVERAVGITGTTLNVMFLIGVVMLAGITMSDSILIVEFAHRLLEDGMAVREAVITACRVRLRPILMTTLATIIGLLPMALKMGEGSESYAPLA